VQPAEGIVVADRFRLVRPLGRGGMGSVWQAQHTSLDSPCAVKFLLAEAADSADVRARFEREAKAAAQLKICFIHVSVNQAQKNNTHDYLLTD
jgi:serine/threonine protein kinase